MIIEQFFNTIPSEWMQAPIKFLCDQYGLYGANESADSYSDHGVRFIRTSDILDDGNLIEGGVYLPLEKVDGYLLNDGDFLISRSGTVGRAFVYTPEWGMCAYAGYLVRFIFRQDQNPRYFFYLTKSPEFQSWLKISTIEATIGNVNAEKYSNLTVPTPPLQIQNSIVHYLDKEITKIDTMIHAKERLLGLLEEKRRALIAEAVTRGVKATADMRDSGVEWLGAIPRHWALTQLKYVAFVNPTKSRIRNFSDDMEVTFLPMELVGEGSINTETTKQLSEVREGFTYFAENDVLVAKITPSFENGKGAIAQGLKNGLGFGTTELHVLRPSNKLLPEFLYYLTNSYVFRQMGAGFMQGTAGQKRIPSDFLQNYPVALPPLAEQQLIVNYLKVKTEQLVQLSDTLSLTIVLLKERRIALIAAAVTGQHPIPTL